MRLFELNQYMIMIYPRNSKKRAFDIDWKLTWKFKAIVKNDLDDDDDWHCLCNLGSLHSNTFNTTSDIETWNEMWSDSFTIIYSIWYSQ